MLTPLDIESKVFSKSVSGYSVSEVKVFMKELLSNYEKLYKENIELKDKLNVLNEGVQYYKNIEETLQNTLVLAEKAAEDTRVLARQKAEQIEKEAMLQAEVMINEAKNEVYNINRMKEELLRTYEASKIQIKQYLKAQLELVEQNDIELKIRVSSMDQFNDINESNISVASSEKLQQMQQSLDETSELEAAATAEEDDTSLDEEYVESYDEEIKKEEETEV